MMRYNVETIIKSIESGDIAELDCEKLSIFQRILPKSGEVQKLKEAIILEGFSSFEEALRVVQFGKVEEFIIKLSLYDDLELKVSILYKLMSFLEHSNDILMGIENWIRAFDAIQNNNGFKMIV